MALAPNPFAPPPFDGVPTARLDFSPHWRRGPPGQSRRITIH